MVKYKVGIPADLTDEQLINNIAIIKRGKLDTKGMDIDENKLVSLFEAELIKRGESKDSIVIKVEDIMAGIGDINGSEKDSKFWGFVGKSVDTASDIGDVAAKFKSFFTKGETIEEENGSSYDIKPYEERKVNYTPYIIGGVVLFAVIGGVLFFVNKNSGK